MANNILIGVNYHNFTKDKSEFMSKKTAFFYFLFSIVCLVVFATICYMDFAKSVNVAMYALACFSLLFSIISFSIFKTGNSARILLHEQMSEKV